MYKALLVFIIFITLFLCLYNLGNWAFQDFDEAIYAKVFHESLANSNFTHFTFLGRPWIDKPPLYFWLMRISETLFNESELSLRLPSAMLTILSIFLVYKIPINISKDKITGLFSALILLSTALFIFAGRQLRLDIPVTSMILFSFYCFLNANKNVKKGNIHILWSTAFAIGLASAFLFKSVIGLLIFPVICVYAYTFKEWSWIKSKWFWGSILLACLLIIPWHIQQALHFGGVFWDQYFFNIGNRLSGELVLGQNVSILHQLWQISLATQPWFLVFIIVGFVIFFQKIRTQFTLFNFVTTSILLIIFLIPKNRLLYYFIPSLPFLAMFLGSVFSNLREKNTRLWTTVFIFLFILGITNTVLKIFSDNDRDIFLQKTTSLSRYQIAQNEKEVGLISLSKPNENLYIYRWQFYPTLLYYSQKNELYKINSLENLSKKGLLLFPAPLLKNSILPTDLRVIYRDKAAILFSLNKK